jgi:hypothetical protein
VLGVSPAILSVGGRVGYVDDGETPNTLLVWHGYEKAPLFFEVRGLPDHATAAGTKEQMDKYKGASVGIVIECEGGYVTVPSYGTANVYDNSGKEIKTFKDSPTMPDGSKRPEGTRVHFDNFQKACRSRKYEDLYADIEQGHLSSALCHTGNISFRVGNVSEPEAIEAAIKGNAIFAEAYGRMLEHLKKNNVDISKEKLTLGAPLKMDGKAERFTDNEAANALLTRKYRAPYVVPEKVV